MKNEFKFLDKISIGSFIIDWNYKILFWNKILENWTSMNRESMIGKDIDSIYEQFKKEDIRIRLNSVFSFGTPVVLSSQIHKYLIPCTLPNNRHRYHQTMITAIKIDETQQNIVLYSQFRM